MFRYFLLILLTVPLLATAPIGITQTIEQLFDQAEAAYNQGKYTEAESIFRQVIQIDQNNAKAYAKLCNVLYDLDKLDEAIEACSQAIKLNPNDASAYNELGNVLYDQGKLDEAISVYEKAIKFNPYFAYAYYNMGNALYYQRKLEEAITAYQQAIKLSPDNASAYNGLGNVLYDQGKLDEAIAVYEKAIKFNPYFAYAYYNMGNALYGQGKLEEAISAYRKALSLPDEKGTPVVEFYSTLTNEKRPRYKVIEKITDNQDHIDLAVLKVEGIPDDIEPLKFKSGWVQRNLSVTIIGHPYNIKTPWSSVEGEVMNYDPNNDFIPLNALVADGNSGGPVLNPEGQVIAMMVSIRKEDDIVPVNNRGTQIVLENPRSTGDIGLAYRINIVIEKIQEWGIKINQ